jgi:hypothetical protein
MSRWAPQSQHNRDGYAQDEDADFAYFLTGKSVILAGSI